MLCQECQSKTATVHLTKIINGEATEIHLCDTCAGKYQQQWSQMLEPFSINKFLANLLNHDSSFSNQNKSLSVFTCSQCGNSYHDFMQAGKFGCAECYNTFGNKIAPLLKRVHGLSKHKGKIPKRVGGNIKLKRELEDLRYQLNEHIKNEEFEEAAKIRDEIKVLEKKIQNS